MEQQESIMIIHYAIGRAGRRRVCSTALITSLLGKSVPTTPVGVYNTYRRLISVGIIEPYSDSANQLTQKGRLLASCVVDKNNHHSIIKKYATSFLNVSEKVLFASAMTYYTSMVLYGEIKIPEAVKILDAICSIHGWDPHLTASSLYFMQNNGLST
jgi:hypothetical protein